MNRVTNTKLIERNAKIGTYSNGGALVILLIGLVISFYWPDKFSYALGALMVGFLLSQVGIYYGNRWSRRPRPDEIIDKSLKGLGREYTIYHYVTPVHHLLLCPSGIWTIIPFHQAGTLTYKNKRWQLKGGGFVQGYLRIFGQENIGRPDLESAAEIDAIKRYLVKKLPEGAQLPPFRTALLFANPKIDLHTEGAPLVTMTPKDLKEFFRRTSKEEPASELLLDQIRQALPQAEIEDE